MKEDADRVSSAMAAQQDPPANYNLAVNKLYTWVGERQAPGEFNFSHQVVRKTGDLKYTIDYSEDLR